MEGWCFAREDRRLRSGDGRRIVVGETHKVDGHPELYYHGLYASTNLLHALAAAPGPILFRVRLGGTIVHRYDGGMATERTYLAEIDATELLRRFVRECVASGPRSQLHSRVHSSLPVWASAVVAAMDATRAAAARAAARAREAAGEAAGDAAWTIAWDAASAKQRRRLTAMVAAEMRREWDEQTHAGAVERVWRRGVRIRR